MNQIEQSIINQGVSIVIKIVRDNKTIYLLVAEKFLCKIRSQEALSLLSTLDIKQQQKNISSYSEDYFLSVKML